MEVSIPACAQPVVPQLERTLVAVRATVARLDVTVLPVSRAEWTAATAQARDEYCWPPDRVERAGPSPPRRRVGRA